MNSISVGGSVSIHLKDTTRRGQAQWREKALLRYDHTEWGHRIQGSGRIICKTVWFRVHHRWGLRISSNSNFKFKFLLTFANSSEFLQKLFRLRVPASTKKNRGNWMTPKKRRPSIDCVRKAMTYIDKAKMRRPKKNIKPHWEWLSNCSWGTFAIRLKSNTTLDPIFTFVFLRREKPHDTEWLALIKTKIPLLLNYSQCMLLKKDYYAVIEYCSEVLVHEPSNVKALYRRAKAHVGAWNPDDAKRDYQKCLELDKSLKKKVTRELDDLNEQIRINELNNKLKFQKMFDWMWVCRCLCVCVDVSRDVLVRLNYCIYCCVVLWKEQNKNQSILIVQ